MKKYIIGIPSHLLLQVISVLIMTSLGGAIIEHYRGNINNSSVFLLLAFSAFLIGIVYAIQFLCNGYEVRNKTIYVYDSFKKKAYSFYDIKAIVISNAYIGGRYGKISPMYIKNKRGERVIRPWFTLLFDNSDLDKIISQNINGELNSFILQEEWLKDRAFIGFEYNKNVIPEILEEYKGKIYIAKTVATNYEYSTCTQNVLVIKDICK